MERYNPKICPFCDGPVKYNRLFRKFVCIYCGASTKNIYPPEFWKAKTKNVDRANAKKSRI